MKRQAVTSCLQRCQQEHGHGVGEPHFSPDPDLACLGKRQKAALSVW
jgi:hypothetical protein